MTAVVMIGSCHHAIKPRTFHLAKRMGMPRFKSAVSTYPHETHDYFSPTITDSHISPGKPGKPDFTNAQAAYASKTTPQLLRAVLVYNLCNVSPLVRNAEAIMKLTRRVFGDTITDMAMKLTLFGHFCAGEDEDRIKPVLQELQTHGIGGILDYAAESDSEPVGSGSDHAPNSYRLPTRVYDYESEAVCDEHVEVFRSCIRSVHKVAPDGFAAVKVTALGNPKLLERMSSAIVEAENLFAKIDKNNVSTCL